MTIRRPRRHLHGVEAMRPRPQPRFEPPGLDALRQPGVFNPSLLVQGRSVHVTYRRLEPRQATPPSAHYYRSSHVRTECVDLTAIAADHGVGPVSDPKLFIVGEEIWTTFNTGFQRDGNHVFVMRLHPRLGRPLECILKPRGRVEKNWAFFVRDGRFHAYYSLEPARVIREVDRNEERGHIRFAFVGESSSFEPVHPLGLAIGTQALVSGSDHLIVAHEKFRLLRWRVYVGRPVRLRYSSNGRVDVHVSPHRLIHSFASLLGSRRRPNSRLLSCT
ncbi:MAG: hypothetical protein LC667_08185, partial [Thioalkalivibrio sp.]|nr:hypothetical protein [Thioalkalivibrio sp.]